MTPSRVRSLVTVIQISLLVLVLCRCAALPLLLPLAASAVEAGSKGFVAYEQSHHEVVEPLPPPLPAAPPALPPEPDHPAMRDLPTPP